MTDDEEFADDEPLDDVDDDEPLEHDEPLKPDEIHHERPKKAGLRSLRVGWSFDGISYLQDLNVSVNK